MVVDVRSALVELGLTSADAEVFLAAVEIGGGTAREVSVAAQKERGNVHHTLEKLGRLGIVDTVLESPTRFIPMDVTKAIDHLYSLQATRLGRLDALRKEVGENIASAGLRGVRQEETYSIVKGRVNNYLRMIQSIQSSGESVTLLLSAKGITRVRRFRNFLAVMGKKAEEGVEFRVITDIRKDNVEDIEAMGEVAEVRHIRSQPSNASVYDGAVGSVALTITEGLEEDVMEHIALWTTGRSFVTTLADYFDSVWFVAAPSEPTLRTVMEQ